MRYVLRFFKTGAGSPTLLRKVVTLMGHSVESGNNISTSRLQSYFVLLPVLLSCFTFLTIEIVNAIIQWVHTKTYTISTEAIIIFGMILAHHLGILFSRPKTYEPASSNPMDVAGNVNLQINQLNNPKQQKPGQQLGQQLGQQPGQVGQLVVQQNVQPGELDPEDNAGI